MKYLFLSLSVLLSLSACSVMDEYYGNGPSAETCYGLGNPACVREGHRDSVEMRPEMTVDELNKSRSGQ
ncbi:hypothetical protein [Neisseria montereyensis]|uniref:Lipoprotein n=1 Tax=Neisseria montereyensis TaxID=2973938 RepID=A0ABT2FFW0_9NEIS|nr:hypothetical protein [Neisseria montereyensis]MCS4534333.1 hypothetical protein [Neisseria montereyensis]